MYSVPRPMHGRFAPRRAELSFCLLVKLTDFRVKYCGSAKMGGCHDSMTTTKLMQETTI
jgi:hypothetical protein